MATSTWSWRMTTRPLIGGDGVWAIANNTDDVMEVRSINMAPQCVPLNAGVGAMHTWELRPITSVSATGNVTYVQPHNVAGTFDDVYVFSNPTTVGGLGGVMRSIRSSPGIKNVAGAWIGVGHAQGRERLDFAGMFRARGGVVEGLTLRSGDMLAAVRGSDGVAGWFAWCITLRDKTTGSAGSMCFECYTPDVHQGAGWALDNQNANDMEITGIWCVPLGEAVFPKFRLAWLDGVDAQPNQDLPPVSTPVPYNVGAASIPAGVVFQPGPFLGRLKVPRDWNTTPGALGIPVPQQQMASVLQARASNPTQGMEATRGPDVQSTATVFQARQGGEGLKVARAQTLALLWGAPVLNAAEGAINTSALGVFQGEVVFNHTPAVVSGVFPIQGGFLVR